MHELYANFSIEVHQTRRNINKIASRRVGEDFVITVSPKRHLTPLQIPAALPDQVECFPSTQFMGSKQDLVGHIWSVASHFDFDSVLDLFSGSGIVSYMFKAQGKQVISNDYMHFSTTISKALVENNNTVLTERDIALLCDGSTPRNDFVSNTFRGLYFVDDDNRFIDTIRANLPRLRSKAKRSLAMAALVRACLKKRPRGIFTFIGHRYDDGRRDLALDFIFHEQFLEAVAQVNGAVLTTASEIMHCATMLWM